MLAVVMAVSAFVLRLLDRVPPRRVFMVECEVTLAAGAMLTCDSTVEVVLPIIRSVRGSIRCENTTAVSSSLDNATADDYNQE